MKKLLSLILVVIYISVLLIGCAGKDNSQTESIATETATEPTQAPTDASTEKPTLKPTQAPKNNTWKQLYKDCINEYISEVDYKDDVEFSLVFIDNDDIPELVAGIPSHINAATLFWVYNDDLNEEVMGYTVSEGFTYIEKSGLIRICSQWQGTGGDTIFELSNGELLEIASGTFNNVDYKCTWNGESVGPMDYDHMLNEVFFELDAKDVVETVYGYDSIISVIDSF